MKALIAVIVIAAVAIGGYFMFRPNKTIAPSEPADTSSQSAQESPVPADGKKMAFAEFMKTNKGSYVCTVNQNVGGTDTAGTVHVNGMDISGQFAITAAGQSLTAYVVSKDGYVYTWTSMMPTVGWKSKMTTSGSGSTAASGTFSWNNDTIGDYDCQPEPVNASLFTIPASVNFTAVN